jgi:hypothetical protein
MSGSKSVTLPEQLVHRTVQLAVAVARAQPGPDAAWLVSQVLVSRGLPPKPVGCDEPRQEGEGLDDVPWYGC